jgi:hypothetical protein
VDYRISSGEILSFGVEEEGVDVVLFDQRQGIEVPRWKDRLLSLVKDYGLDVDDGHGLSAFVYPLLEQAS